MTSNCSNLDSYSGFVTYVHDLRKATSDNLTVSGMQPCRSDICSTLYGVGNADISGIGVLTAYIIHLILGVFLASLVLYSGMPGGKLGRSTTNGDPKQQSRLVTATARVYERYADAAVVLAFSVQVAAMVLIIQKLFGISAVNFGSLTVEVTWAAALLSILPMPLIYLIPSRTVQRRSEDSGSQQHALDDLEEAEDLLLLSITPAWVLFVFTFACRMASYYSTGQVGDGPGQVMSSVEAQNVKELCFRRESIIPPRQQLAFDVFSLGGSLFVCVVFMGILVDAVGRKVGLSWYHGVRGSRLFAKLRNTAGQSTLIVSVMLWGIPQIWIMSRFREIQSTLARSINTADNDSQWSFGQVMAVVVFLPVAIQCLYELLRWPPEMKLTDSHTVGTAKLDEH